MKRIATAVMLASCGLMLVSCSSGSGTTPPVPASTAACSAELHRLYDQYSQDNAAPSSLTSAPPQCAGVSNADLNTIVDQIIASAFASMEASPTP